MGGSPLAETGMKYFLSVVLLITMSLANLAQGQRIRSFSDDGATFLNELGTLLLEGQNGEASVESMDIFRSYWNSGVYTADEEVQIIAMSNQMLKKRVRPFPGFMDYVEALIAVADSADDLVTSSWFQSTAQIIDSRSGRSIDQYMLRSKELFRDRILFKSAALEWRWIGGLAAFRPDEAGIVDTDEGALICYAKKDSSAVYNTRIAFNLMDDLLTGQGGELYWTRAGISEDSLRAELGTYTIRTDRTEWEADSVTLYSKFYITEPMLGSLQENILASAQEGNYRFPVFTSYNKEFQIPDIVEGVYYEGGFSAQGDRFIGYGTEERKAKMLFEFENEPRLKALSNRFVLSEKEIIGGDCRITVIIEEDSLYHPKIQLRFFIDERMLSLYREDEGLAQRPYSNSYHKVEMYFDRLEWDMDEPVMKLSNLQAGDVNPVVLESFNFYRDERFDQLQGMDDSNVLYVLKKMWERSDHQEEFWIEEVAQYLRMELHQCKLLMMEMTIMGFVNYDLEEGRVKFEKRMFDYINARGGFIDYDIIRFVSVAEKQNARLNLLNQDLELYGVRPILLSDSQKVVLFPAGGFMVLKEDRDFNFGGTIQAGRFDFIGRDFFFEYKNFRINMNTIDSMKFLVPSFEADEYGRRELVPIKNKLQDMRGELFIDKPNNKSSRAVFPEYPIFRSGNDSYVYWDDRRIFNGVYDRSKVYFHVEPFEIDSLDSFETEGLAFNGQFYSGDIFPMFEEDLKVMRDYSLGFITSTPSTGFPAYGGKGQYVDTIKVSNKGIEGKGRLDYLTSSIHTTQSLFFLDSMNALADTFLLRAQLAGTEYPPARAENARVHWEPYNDVMYIRNGKGQPFNIFDINAEHKGFLALRPSGLQGGGRTDFENAQTDAALYTFDHHRLYSDALNFRVHLVSDTKWSFSLNNARGDIDFSQRRGEFTLNDPGYPLELHDNRYSVYMDHAVWDMDAKTFDLDQLATDRPAYMVSDHPDQDSLNYEAKTAKYYMADTLLEGFGVDQMAVADAWIYPDSAFVSIGRNANMARLKNANVSVLRDDPYHEFYEATLKVKGRNEYWGNSKIDYLDRFEEAFPIVMDTMYVDTAYQTLAHGKVPSEQEFYLSPFFSFEGEVFVYGNDPDYVFDGFTEIQHACDAVVTDKIPFRSKIDPERIAVDLSRLEAERERNQLYSGLFYTPDPVDMTSNFLSKKANAYSEPNFTSTGWLIYDEPSNEYRISTEARLENDDVPDQFMAFNNKTCEVRGIGAFELDEDLQGLFLNTRGEYVHDLSRDTIEMDLFMGIGFFFNEEALGLMANNINDDNSLKGVDLDRPAYRDALIAILGKEKALMYMEEVRTYGSVEKLPKELRQMTLVLTDVQWAWNDYTSSYLTVGDIGIGSIGEYQVNKKVQGKMELVRKRRQDEFTLYLQLDRRNWYYFALRRNIMQILSSDELFNDEIKDLDLKKRQAKLENGQYFQYTISTKRRLDQWLSRFDEFY